MSEYCPLQFIFRYEIGDAYLGAVSRFMTNAFEYGDALLPQPEGDEKSDGESTSSHAGSNTPYLNLATCVISILSLTKTKLIRLQIPNGRTC